jgi:pantoate--beta-alanine ligase
MTTRLITTVAEMKAFALDARARGRSLALVPTMGALHEGHLSLVRQAHRQCDIVVVSIFVNPAQFGPAEDFARYPRTLEKDLEALRTSKIDAVFAPSEAEMYPEGFQTFAEPGEIAALFEGAHRPGHFRGVATVVLKLFNLVRPDVAYFGQKDFQQVQVIRRLVEDLNLDVRLVVCPIVREADGLAMSSRNAYLSPQDRQAALALPRCLRRAEELVHAGESETPKLLEEMRQILAAEPRAQVDYLAIVEPARLQPVKRVAAGSVALVAARVGTVRLIDNVIFGPPGATPELRLQLALTAQPAVETGAHIPGLATESLRLKIENCRDCAAISSILLPPREFLVKYLKRNYPDLNAVRTVVIGRDAPMHPDHFLYRQPDTANRFVIELYELLGVRNFDEFKARFALTDAVRCHTLGDRVAEKALDYCAKHLREELKLFPNLESIVVLGEDAYRQFQKLIVGREASQIKPFDEFLRPQGWARETVRLPSLGERAIRVFYCYHPTYGYKRSPSLAPLLR